mgnify:CR=1 FL=1
MNSGKKKGKKKVELIDIVNWKPNKVREICNVSKGTLDRWIKKQKVPEQYTFDLYKIAGIKIDYNNFSPKFKNQYFTDSKTAKYIVDKFKSICGSDFKFIEPSAGNGAFLPFLDNPIAMDIEPRNDLVHKKDFLEYTPKVKSPLLKYACIGNPPFGLRGQLALKFINHSAKFADAICFILPSMFASDGRGTPMLRVNKEFNLVLSERLNGEIFYYPNGEKVKVECIFQIWSKTLKAKNELVNEVNEDILKIYSLSNGATKENKRNIKMIGNCDIYIPSTCFQKEKFKWYSSFDELPGKKGYGIVFKNKIDIVKCMKIKWNTKAFLSTNGSYNIRRSQISTCFA